MSRRRDGPGGAHPGAAATEDARADAITVVHSLDALIFIRLDGRIAFVDSGAERLFGYTSDELRGQPIETLIPERARGRHEAHCSSFRSEPHVRPMSRGAETPGRRKSGSEFLVEVVLSSVETEQGRLVLAALRESSGGAAVPGLLGEGILSRNLLKAQVDLGEGVAMADIHTERFLYVNGPFCTITGYGEDELLALRSFMDLVPPDQKADIGARVGSRRQGESIPENLETVILHKSGRRVDINLAVQQPDAHRVVTIVRDITDRKRMERALRASEERFRLLAENAQDIVYLYRLGPTRGFEYVSPAATAITGYTPEEHYADPDLGMKIVHPEDRPLIEGMLTAPKMAPSQLTLRWVRKDGRVIWTEQRNVPIADEDGTIVAIEGIARDVSARVRSEETLQRALEGEREATARLLAADEIKKTFLRAVSHDLRNPLSVIQGLAEVLHERLDRLAPEDGRLLAERIVANAEHMNQMLSDLLDFDRLQKDRLEPERRPTEVAAVVQDVLHGSELGDHQVEVDVEPLTAQVDPVQMERIVANLVENAVKHTPPGTPIWIRARREDGGLVLIVEDAGPGVRDGLKEVIFEPFRRGETGSSGTGVGLFLVARFAELHGGRAWVEDRPGGGASFRVFLPDPPADAGSQAP